MLCPSLNLCPLSVLPACRPFCLPRLSPGKYEALNATRTCRCRLKNATGRPRKKQAWRGAAGLRPSGSQEVTGRKLFPVEWMRPYLYIASVSLNRQAVC